MSEELKWFVVSGLEKLDMAAILMMIVAILGFVWAVDASSTGSMALSIRNFGVLPVVGGVSLIILLAMLILCLVATYAKLIPSARDFAMWRLDSLSTPAKLLSLGFVWGIILFIIGVIIAAAAASTKSLATFTATAIAVLIAAILILLGYIGLVTFLFRLGRALNSKMFLITAVIFILIPITRLIAGFIPRIVYIPWLFEFEAWLLTYVEIDTVKKKMISGAIQI
ncbi:MAG: hypothetical protein QXF10_09290 [Ignisphaera sp.]